MKALRWTMLWHRDRRECRRFAGNTDVPEHTRPRQYKTGLVGPNPIEDRMGKPRKEHPEEESVGLGFSVITCGQRRQAFRPSCWNQRQVGRIWQGGRALTTGAKPSTILWASVHALPLKCLQPLISQGAAMRKIVVGFAGPESARSFSETGCVSVR